MLAPVAHWWGGVRPRRADLRADAVAGLPGAIGSVPDGMASAVLAGVNPVYGLYASMAGPLAGGLATSTRLMVISTTTAAALAAGSALESVPEAAASDGTTDPIVASCASWVNGSPVATVGAWRRACVTRPG